MDNEIIRTGLPYRHYSEIDNIFPHRIPEDDIQKFKKLLQVPEFSMWFYQLRNPKTKRKLKPDNNVHRLIGKQNGYLSYKYCKRISELDDNYVSTTKRMEVEKQQYKQEIEEENKKLKELQKSLDMLEKWEDFIVYNGKKYGLPPVIGKVHKENNCNGSITKTSSDKYCNCSSCENWFGCGNPITTTYTYTCDRCGYSYQTVDRYYENYRRK